MKVDHPSILQKFLAAIQLLFIICLCGCGAGQREPGIPIVGGTVGGTISGLNGVLVLQNNSTETLSVTAQNSFTFSTKIPDGSTYSVSVLTQPTGQYCSLVNNTGRLGQTNINNVAITCLNIIGGSVQGKILSLTPVVSTLAGHSTLIPDGVGTLASFSFPQNTVADGAGNLFVADTGNNIIRKIVIATGVVTTIAGQFRNPGCTDGSGTTATFQNPVGIATDGLSLFVTDSNNKIRKITPPTGTLLSEMTSATAVVSSLTGIANSTITSGLRDGLAINVSFNNPTGITTDGTYLYVTDSGNNSIRQVTIADGWTSSLTPGSTSGGATDGIVSVVTFSYPNGITIDSSHTHLYIADTGNNRIRQVTIADGSTSSLTTGSTSGGATDGIASVATFHSPYGISIDSTNTHLYVADTLNNKIRQINVQSGYTSSFTGAGNISNSKGLADGSLTTASFNSSYGISSDATNLYVADAGNNEIRKINISSGQVSSLAGAVTTDGIGTLATLDNPAFTTTDGINLYVSNCSSAGPGTTSTIRKIEIATGNATTLAGSPTGATGNVDGVGTAAKFMCPSGITNDGAGNLYVADPGNYNIRKIEISSGAVTTLAQVTTFSSPSTGVAITTDGINLYVADPAVNYINVVNISTGIASQFTPASAIVPVNGITTDGAGNIFLSDGTHNLISKVEIATGTVTAVASSSSVASEFRGITTDGYNLYVADYGNGQVLVVSPTNGYTLATIGPSTSTVAILAGNAAITGSADGPGATATFDTVSDVTTDGSSIFITDYTAGTIRVIR
jgi:sugar lactone lactonase YvrE